MEQLCGLKAYAQDEMGTKTKISVGTLILLILSTSIYITMNDVRVRVDNDKSTFYVPHEQYSWLWVVSGREYNSIFDGSSKMNRDLSGIEVKYEINDLDVKITRITPYKRGPVIKDTYMFSGAVDSVELFPVSHTVEVYNASGYFYRYEVRDLIYDGPTKKLDVTKMKFGRKMVAEWQEGFRWAWVYASGVLKIQYDIPTDYELFRVRLYDPDNVPETIANLKVWLRADKLALSDGDPVTTWIDAAPEGNNFTQATATDKPTFMTNVLGGQDALYFNGTDSYMNMSDMGMTNISIITVWKTNYSGPMETPGPNGYIYNKYLSTSEGVGLYQKDDDSILYFLDDLTPTPDQSLYPVDTISNEERVYITQLNIDIANNAKYWVNNREMNPTPHPMGATFDFGGYWVLGKRRFTPGNTFRGWIAEVIIYGGNVTGSDKDALYSYLTERYGFCTLINSTTNMTIGINTTFCPDQEVNDTYITLTGNDINLNCNGSTTIGNNVGVGIFDQVGDNAIINNCNLKNYSIAIHHRADGGNISNNSIYNSTQGIRVRDGLNNIVENNYVNGSGNIGINIDTVSNSNIIINNILTFNNIDIYVQKGSSYNQVLNNTVSDGIGTSSSIQILGNYSGFANSQYNNISGNIVNRSGWNSVDIGSTDNRVFNNVLDNATHLCIDMNSGDNDLRDGENNSVYSNTCLGDAILVRTQSFVKVYNNTLYNGRIGVEGNTTILKGTHIFNNTCNNCNISLLNGANNTLWEDNTISNDGSNHIVDIRIETYYAYPNIEVMNITFKNNNFTNGAANYLIPSYGFNITANIEETIINNGLLIVNLTPNPNKVNLTFRLSNNNLSLYCVYLVKTTPWTYRDLYLEQPCGLYVE